MKLVSILLILLSVYVGISHGSRSFTKPSEVYLQMMASLSINNTMRFLFGIWAVVATVLILFPKTFFIGNTLRALQLVLLMSLALKAGNYKFALIEIPFLGLPLLLIYLGHPLSSVKA